MIHRLHALMGIFMATAMTLAATTDTNAMQSYRLDLTDVGDPGPLDGVFWGMGEDALRCGRRDESLFISQGTGPVVTLDFGRLAQVAIDRDVFHASRKGHKGGPWDGGSWDGSWDKTRMVDTSVLFDVRGRAYTLLIPRYSNLKHAVLLSSRDGCRHWQASVLTGVNATLEKPDAFNDRSGPPTILSFEGYGHNNGPRLWLESLRVRNNKLVFASGSPAIVATDSELVANHSGGGNSSFTTAHMIHVVYPTNDLGEGQGTLSVARSFDRDKGVWAGPPVPIGRSTTLKGPDNHDLPAITFGPDGHAIVVVGAHHAVLEMYTAKRSGSVTSGWVGPETVGDPQRGARFAEYSYVSLNMAKNGTINIIARNEGDNGYYQLVQFRRTAGGHWTDWPDGLPHRLIATPARHAYAAWRQRVFQAPDGTLELSFVYYPNQLTDEEAIALHFDPHKDAAQCVPSTHRCWYMKAPSLLPRTLFSHDDGLTWREYPVSPKASVH